ncbi:MAG: hypothetical protein JO364_20030 [Pseudonocardiales bacterium]|nr:hypothetical protein [Pseudonocardiales bacterium]
MATGLDVLSPSTRRIDRLSKLSAYEEAGAVSVPGHRRTRGPRRRPAP